MFPRTSNSTCPAASPCTRLSRAPSTTNESDFHRSLCFPQDSPFGQHTQPRQQAKTPVDLPGAMTFPFPPMPCSQTPPESPATIAFSGHLLLPSRFSTLSASGCITRLHRFTCVTAWTALCLRLTHVVTFMSPRLDSRWGGSSPFPGREFHPLKTPGLTWRTKEALEGLHGAFFTDPQKAHHARLDPVDQGQIFVAPAISDLVDPEGLDRAQDSVFQSPLHNPLDRAIDLIPGGGKRPGARPTFCRMVPRLNCTVW